MIWCVCRSYNTRFCKKNCEVGIIFCLRARTYFCVCFLFLGACWARKEISWANWLAGMWSTCLFLLYILGLQQLRGNLILYASFFQYHKQTQLESMASEKAALEFQLEKSLKQFHEVQVDNLSSSCCRVPHSVYWNVLILLPLCYLCPPFDRLKQKGVNQLVDPHRHGKKILISRH
jgi:hypothetical protein